MSPRYAFETDTEPLSPAAVGSACNAFFRPFAATSAIKTQPLHVPDPLAIVGHEAPAALPSNNPVSALIRYIALPALGAAGPRLGINASMSGKYPDPTIAAVTVRFGSSAPTAGSDHV